MHAEEPLISLIEEEGAETYKVANGPIRFSEVGKPGSSRRAHRCPLRNPQSGDRMGRGPIDRTFKRGVIS